VLGALHHHVCVHHVHVGRLQNHTQVNLPVGTRQDLKEVMGPLQDVLTANTLTGTS